MRYLIALAFFVAGCNHGPTLTSVAGKYKAELNLPEENPGKPIEGLVNTLAKQVELELRPDGTYTLTIFVKVEGTFVVNGRTLELSRPDADKPTLAKVSSDGQTIELLSRDPKEGTLLFRKQAN